MLRLYLLFVLALFLQSEYHHPFVHAQCSLPRSCNQTSGPVIQFPFWRKGEGSDFCETPGFELSCNNKNETILFLPFSGDFIVKDINYSQQLILINDRDSCLPKRLENFNPSPFRVFPEAGRYNFFNCSSNWTYTGEGGGGRLSCLSSRNYTVYAVPSSYIDEQQISSSCFNMAESSTSMYWKSLNAQGDIQLRWSRRLVAARMRCLDCATKGVTCAISNNNEVVCLIPGEQEESKHGFPRSAKYGIIIGVGIPVVLLIVGLGCHICNKIKAYNYQTRLLSRDRELSAAVSTPRPMITITSGLDGQTIESYPKTVLGESRRLPTASNGDGTCPICLCEYEAKESLRSIPECNHYFHVDCIDEWLKLNGTCPLCRKSPGSFLVTPC